MNKYKILSGDEIVAKGATKIEATLPEIGLKDVTPNGSWLEQKQIQSALEARKHLIGVQRIEKSGVLTHAKWDDKLKLAEVIQQAGGFWQFVGHHRDNRLYLRPEEALFLMEVNCLLLRYNAVPVSLQMAYTLLLSDEISIIQYKVYASLSRLGYKVFRHLSKPAADNSKKIILQAACKQSETDRSDDIEKTVVCDKFKEVLPASSNDTIMCVDTVTEESEICCVSDDKCSKSNADSSMDTDDTVLREINEENNDETVHKIVNKTCEQNKTVENESTTIEDSKIFENANKNTIKATCNVNDQNEMIVEQINFNAITSESKDEGSTDMHDSTDKAILKVPIEVQTLNVSGCSDSMELVNIESPSCSSLRQNTSAQEQELKERSDDNRETQLTSHTCNSMTNIDPLTKYCQFKLDKLKERRSKAGPLLDVHKSFKSCPNILENQIITIKIPKEEYLPKNIFINNLQYVINIENVRTKNVATPASADSTYSLPDEVNGSHIRRVTNVTAHVQTPMRSQAQTQQNSGFPQFFPSFRPNVPFRHYNFWRPRPHMSYFQFNLYYQRPFMANLHPRFQFFPRMHMPMFPRHSNPLIDFSANDQFRELPINNNTRKRQKDNAKISHLENLKNLALRLKNLISSGTNRTQNIEAIQNLIQTYNLRFRTRLRLSDQYEIVSDETIIDTITLDDEDEESKAKRPRLDDQPNHFIENLNKVRQTALKLKKLESENKSTARHRRALSGVIKTFNKYFKAEIYMNDHFEILDRRHINLDSSSDSDCVIEEIPKYKSGKKLRNPFNILKKLSEKQVSPSSPSTSRQEIPESPITPIAHDTNEALEKYFKKPWLPGDEDFGRPEIISRENMTARFVETKKEELLLDFIKDQSYKFKNWVDLKIAFLESIEETNAILHTGAMLENNVDIKSLVKPEDCTDMASVLKKLSIISGKKNIKNESILAIDYDVYNRDVKNFRKAERPKPHFRVICIDESSARLSGIDIATLHADVEDNVTVLFAIVGTSSISFVQLNPVDLPVYLPSNDLG